jgi:lysozyme
MPLAGRSITLLSVDLAVPRLKSDEGFRSISYTDTTGHQTIGYGFNVSAGISQYAATALLQAQVQEIANTLSTYPWFTDDARGAVLIDLGFNLGITGLLHFPQMLSCLSAKDYQGAHDQLLDSQAARQLPQRYNSLAQTLLIGA